MSAPAVPLEGYDYIECRDLRHAWTVLGWFMGTDDRMKRRCRCIRCGTVRVDTIEGWVTRRSYDYPAGYHLDHRPTAGEIREEAMGRAKIYKSELDMERSLRRRAG
jgi:hypothetical protein